MGLVNDASEPGSRLCMKVLWLICITALAIEAAAFPHLGLPLQEPFCDVGTKGGFFVVELISEQLFSLSFIFTKG